MVKGEGEGMGRRWERWLSRRDCRRMRSRRGKSVPSPEASREREAEWDARHVLGEAAARV